MTMPTPHFSEAELTCGCGCGRGSCFMDKEFLVKLETLRTALNEPIVITSGFRCYNYNISDKVGGALDSLHLVGKAVDIAVVSTDKRMRLVSLAIALGFRGIGLDAGFLHLDTRSGFPVMWLYPKRSKRL